MTIKGMLKKTNQKNNHANTIKQATNSGMCVWVILLVWSAPDGLHHSISITCVGLTGWSCEHGSIHLINASLRCSRRAEMRWDPGLQTGIFNHHAAKWWVVQLIQRRDVSVPLRNRPCVRDHGGFSLLSCLTWLTSSNLCGHRAAADPSEWSVTSGQSHWNSNKSCTLSGGRMVGGAQLTAGRQGDLLTLKTSSACSSYFIVVLIYFFHY